MARNISIERRAFAAPPASISEETREITFVASTPAVDSHGTRIRQDWRLERYLANPIVLYQHEADDPIGIGDARVEDGNLLVTIRFAENTECAEEAWALARQGVLRAVSVGFRPGEVVLGDDGVAEIRSPELYEISLVSVPSNPEALARAHNKEAMEQDKEHHERAAQDAAVRSLTEMIAQRDATIAQRDADIAQRDATIAELRRQAEQARDAELLREVDALVGVKITPAQRDAFIEIGRLSRDVFARTVASLPDLPTAGPSPIAPASQVPTSAVDTVAAIERAVAEEMARGAVSLEAAYRAAATRYPALFARPQEA